MATRTRTVTRYRARPAVRRRSPSRVRSYGGKKLSLAVLAGFIPGAQWYLMEPLAAGGQWEVAAQRTVAAFTGYSYGERRWSFNYLLKGWGGPIAGYAVHMIADATGLNQMLRRFTKKLPIEI